ncbi:hypothetical protein BSK62_13275 [Paenibacillus odorifer]|uniref:hypothetical protein n=1 Tax=Paenibacillus odorifer TaxID=189426 RepID=UPI00096C85C5|nr:hypothetical protein [Paenibacillus odorifer]OMD66033.1 hypothetical protein BSK62_13275 [Paenibacillus odorifer]
MKIVKIKNGTEAWDLMDKIFNYTKVWEKNEQEISEFLGFPMNKNIAFQTTSLYVTPEAIEQYRPEWDKEFKKQDGELRQVKKNSKLLKQWNELCEKLDLVVYRTYDFSIKYGFISGRTFHHYGEGYHISFDNDDTDISKFDWAEEISEPEFLRIKADYLEKVEKAS